MKWTTFAPRQIARAAVTLVLGAALHVYVYAQPPGGFDDSPSRQRGAPVPSASPAPATADIVPKLRVACAAKEELLLAVPRPVVVAMMPRMGIPSSQQGTSQQLVARALENTVTMHQGSVAGERRDLEDAQAISINNARAYPAEAPFWNWTSCIYAARLAQLQPGGMSASAQPPDDPVSAGGGGATAGPSATTPDPRPSSLAPADADAVASATFANIQKLLAAEGTGLNLGVAFRMSTASPLNLVAAVTDGLTNAEQLEVHVVAVRSPPGSVRLVVYPRYRGAYVNVSQAQDQTALMRILLGPPRISGPCVYSWAINDRSGNIYDTCTLVSESFPYASIVAALKDVRHVDRIFGEWRPLLKGSQEVK